MHTKSSSSASSSSAAAAASSAPASSTRLVVIEGDTGAAATASSHGANGIKAAPESSSEAGPSRRREGGRNSLRGNASASSSPAPSARETRSASLEEPLTIVKAEAPSTSLLGGASSSHVASSGAVDKNATGSDQASNDPLRTEILRAPPSLPYDVSYPPLHPTLILPPPPAPNETRKPVPLPRSVTEAPMVSELPRAVDEGVPPADARGGLVLPAAIRRSLQEKRERKTNGEEQKTWLTRAGTKRRGPPPSSGPASKARKTTAGATATRPGASASASAAGAAGAASAEGGNARSTRGAHHQGTATGSAQGSSLAAAAAAAASDAESSRHAASSPHVTIDDEATLLTSPAVTDDASLAAAPPVTPSTGQPYLTPLESAMPHASSPRSDTDALMSEDAGPSPVKSEATALALHGVSSGLNGTSTAPSSPSHNVVATPQPKRKPRARRSELENLAFEGLPDIEDRARSPSPSLDGDSYDDGRRRPRAAHRKPRVAISWTARGGSASLGQTPGKEEGAEGSASVGTAPESTGAGANKKIKVEASSSSNPSGIAPKPQNGAASSRGRASDAAPGDHASTPSTRQTRSGTPSTSAQAQGQQQQVPLTPWELASKTRTPVKELAISRLREKAEAASASSSPALATKELGGTEGAEAAHVPGAAAAAAAAAKMEEIIPNEEQCCVCLGNGQFLCCDGCPRSFHFNCMDPPLDIGEMPAPQPQPASSQGATPMTKQESNTDGTLVSEESWFCNVCRAERRAKAAGATPKPAKRKPGTADAIFGPLLEHIDSTTQSTFALPPDVRNYFRGVATASDGSYVNVNLLRPIKVNSKVGAVADERDPYKLKDRHGKPVLCYRCGGSALPAEEGEGTKISTKRKDKSSASVLDSMSTPAPVATLATQDARGAWRKIVSCDFCDQHWHLDCLEPPMIGMPGPMKKWMCPNHIDSLLPRQRVPKAPSAAPQVVPLPVPSEKTIGPGLHYRTRVVNDGHIDIIPDPLDTFFDAEGKGKGGGPGVELVEMPSPADTLAPKLRFAVPEKVVRLDFWQAVEARRNLGRAGADAFPPPSTPLDLLARIASSKLHVARARPVQKLVRSALEDGPASSSSSSEPIEYPFLNDDEIPMSSMRSSLLDEDLEEEERLAASVAEHSALRRRRRSASHAHAKWGRSGAWSTDSLGDSMDEDADHDEGGREQDGESLPTQDTSLTVMAPSTPTTTRTRGQQNDEARIKDASDENLAAAAASLRSSTGRQQRQQQQGGARGGESEAAARQSSSASSSSPVDISASELRSLRAVRELLRLKGEGALMRFLLADDDGTADV